MDPAASGEDSSYGLGIGAPYAVAYMLVVAVLPLLVGAVYYVTARKDGTTFRESVFNWPLVILAGIVAFLLIL